MLLDCNEIIEDRLWVGCYIRPEEVRYLCQLGITIVLNLQSDRDLDYYAIRVEELLLAYEVAGIEHHRIPIPDFDKQALESNLSHAVYALEKALAPLSSRVYVHCTAGINRGPTLAAAYLVKVRGLSAKEAYDYILAKRNCSPYLDILESYEVSMKGERAGQARGDLELGKV